MLRMKRFGLLTRPAVQLTRPQMRGFSSTEGGNPSDKPEDPSQSTPPQTQPAENPQSNPSKLRMLPWASKKFTGVVSQASISKNNDGKPVETESENPPRHFGSWASPTSSSGPERGWTIRLTKQNPLDEASKDPQSPRLTEELPEEGASQNRPWQKDLRPPRDGNNRGFQSFSKFVKQPSKPWDQGDKAPSHFGFQKNRYPGHKEARSGQDDSNERDLASENESTFDIRMLRKEAEEVEEILSFEGDPQQAFDAELRLRNERQDNLRIMDKLRSQKVAVYDFANPAKSKVEEFMATGRSYDLMNNPLFGSKGGAKNKVNEISYHFEKKTLVFPRRLNVLEDLFRQVRFPEVKESMGHLKDHPSLTDFKMALKQVRHEVEIDNKNAKKEQQKHLQGAERSKVTPTQAQPAKEADPAAQTMKVWAEEFLQMMKGHVAGWKEAAKSNKSQSTPPKQVWGAEEVMAEFQKNAPQLLRWMNQLDFTAAHQLATLRQTLEFWVSENPSKELSEDSLGFAESLVALVQIHHLRCGALDVEFCDFNLDFVLNFARELSQNGDTLLAVTEAIGRYLQTQVQVHKPDTLVSFMSFVTQNMELLLSEHRECFLANASVFAQKFRQIIQRLPVLAKDNPSMYRALREGLSELSQTLAETSPSANAHQLFDPHIFAAILLRFSHPEPIRPRLEVTSNLTNLLWSCSLSIEDFDRVNLFMNQIFFLTNEPGKLEFCLLDFSKQTFEEAPHLQHSLQEIWTQDPRKTELCRKAAEELKQELWASLPPVPNFVMAWEPSNDTDARNDPSMVTKNFIRLYFETLDPAFRPAKTIHVLEGKVNGLPCTNLLESSLHFLVLKTNFLLTLPNGRQNAYASSKKHFLEKLEGYHAFQFAILKDAFAGKQELLDFFLDEFLMRPALVEVARNRLAGLVNVLYDGGPASPHLQNVFMGLSHMSTQELLHMMTESTSADDQYQTIGYLAGTNYIDQHIPYNEEEKMFEESEWESKKALEEKRLTDPQDFQQRHKLSPRQLELRFKILNATLEGMEMARNPLSVLDEVPEGKADANKREVRNYVNKHPLMKVPESHPDAWQKPIIVDKLFEKGVVENQYGNPSYVSEFQETLEQKSEHIDRLLGEYRDKVNWQSIVDDGERAVDPKSNPALQNVLDEAQALQDLGQKYLSFNQLNFRLDLRTQGFLLDPDSRRTFYQSYHYLEPHKRAEFDAFVDMRHPTQQNLVEDFVELLAEFNIRQPAAIIHTYFKATNLHPNSVKIARYLAGRRKAGETGFGTFEEVFRSTEGPNPLLDDVRGYLGYQK